MKLVSVARRAAALSTKKAAPSSPGAIAFDLGDAHPDALPDLRKSAIQVLSDHRINALRYGGRFGIAELRALIAERLRGDGSKTSPENVTVVNGAKQGIDLVARLLIDEGDHIVVTQPTYYNGIPIFKAYGARFWEVPLDNSGMCLDRLEALLSGVKKRGEKLPKLIYDVPDFHNPTTVTMSAERRHRLVDMASDFGVYILEDSPYRELRYEGDHLPSLMSYAHADNVLSVGSFAKLLAPGLRLGWVAGPQSLVERIAKLKPDGGSSPFLQQIILEFSKSGGLDRHIGGAKEIYRSNRDRMIAAIQREIPELSSQIPEGGFYVWVS